MKVNDPWESGLPYEPFMGRWSRQIAPVFLEWLSKPDALTWLDVGCGTGALSFLIFQRTNPKAVLGVDSSEAFIQHARQLAQGTPVLRFETGTAEALPAQNASFDLTVSALALNFFPDPIACLLEMKRVTRIDGEIALYVWDYATGMQMLRYFWDAAVSLFPDAADLDEMNRFPICQSEALEATFVKAGLNVIELRALEAPTLFTSFADYWQPFLGGVGPAPGFVAALRLEEREALVTALQAKLPIQADGSIPLMARAWAIRASLL